MEPVCIEAIGGRGLRLEFKKPLVLNPRREFGHIVLEVPELGLSASGETLDEALRELSSDLLWLWQEYAMAPEGSLSADAEELARKLWLLVEGGREAVSC